MKTVHYKVEIAAPAKKVYDTMLGLSDKKTYEGWTSFFDPTSTYEGTWEKDSKILFLGTMEDGTKGGMVSRIEENIPMKEVAIRHYGILKGMEEITEGPEVDEWAGGMERYLFSEKDGITTVDIEVDVSENYVDFFDTTWPKALQRLKELSEAKG